MAQVSVRINGYVYNVGCEDGQEHHLTAMAEQVEGRINSIKALGGQSGESRLLMLAALLMADEIHDLKRDLDDARKSKPASVKRDAGLNKRLEKLAKRAEDIAAGLEQS